MQIQYLNQALADAVVELARLVRLHGGRALVVGGAVRDAVLGLVAKDIDVEVYGIQADALEQLLDERFGVDRVGLSFGILKLKHLDIDVSLPRRESKSGLGHRGFEVMTDPFMSIEEASSRRDFTFNSMLFDPLTDELIDPHGGQADLQDGLLRHTNADSFHEDPLRVLRAVQLTARFDLGADRETIELCRRIPIEGLARERLLDEFYKLLVKGVRPSTGLRVLQDSEWLQHFPELAALREVAPYHTSSQRDVFRLTAHALDHFALSRGDDEREEFIIGLAVLCHGMSDEGADTFLARLINSPSILRPVRALTSEYLMSSGVAMSRRYEDGEIRRIARRVGRFDRFARVVRCVEAGASGLDPVVRSSPIAHAVERSIELGVHRSAPTQIVLGRHLIALGERPGRHFQELLERVFDLQLSGRFETEEEGIEVAREMIRDWATSTPL